MKKRVSIYIDEEVWSEAKEAAWRERISASAYLENLISHISLPVESIEKTEKVKAPKGDVKVGDAVQNLKNFMGSGIKPMPKVKWKE